MDEKQLLNCERIAINLAMSAGQMMFNASGKNKEINQKESYADLVTETDRAIENYLFGELREMFPDYKFMGEETSSKVGLTDNPTWVVDPIDGTMNFVHQFPYVCVSIALVLNKQPILGVIYSPFLNRLYTAKKGHGSFCNGQPIHVKRNAPSSLIDALLITEFGSTRDQIKRDAHYKNLDAVGWSTHGIRSCGSAALNLCSIAHGNAEIYYEFGIHCWDMAAGAIILTEAGGVVLDTKGGPHDLCGRRIIGAASQQLGQELSKALAVHLEFERD